jgi:hypothetical protein
MMRNVMRTDFLSFVKMSPAPLKPKANASPGLMHLDRTNLSWPASALRQASPQVEWQSQVE